MNLLAFSHVAKELPFAMHSRQAYRNEPSSLRVQMDSFELTVSANSNNKLDATLFDILSSWLPKHFKLTALRRNELKYQIMEKLVKEEA